MKNSCPVLCFATITLLSSFGLVHAQNACLQDAQHRWDRLSSNANLQAVQDVLLRRYAEFKQYSTTKPASVKARLSEDRYAVFDAVTRTMFTPLRLLDIATREMEPYGTILDYVYAVVGIWGVRLADPNGAHAFRLTVVADQDLREILGLMGGRANRRRTATETFYPSNYPSEGRHVLQPACEKQKGDDDPNYTAWSSIPTNELETVRLTGDWPKMQISYWDEATPYTLLEIDIDFHDAVHPFDWSSNKCHDTPSNSDPGVAHHPSDFNTRYAALLPPSIQRFAPPCVVHDDNHCEGEYRLYCTP